MEEIIIQFVLIAIEQAVQSAIEGAINYIIRKVVDEAGRCVTEIVYQIDSDGDGLTDSEQVVYTLDTLIPSFDDGYSICNDGDQIGIGFPQFQIIDGTTIGDIISGSDFITGNSDGYIIDLDNDGAFDDVIIPLPDFTGDGLPDWGLVVDDDDNGVPDVSPDSPFYPVGSEEYDLIVSEGTIDGGIIIVSPDGSMCFYDPDGDLVEEDYNTAYSLWLQDNAALTKQFDYYSVSEFLLLIIASFAAISLIGKLFKRRYYL